MDLTNRPFTTGLMVFFGVLFLLTTRDYVKYIVDEEENRYYSPPFFERFTKTSLEVCQGLHLLQDFFILNGDIYKGRMKLDEMHRVTNEMIVQRQEEIIASLQSNLMHVCTSSVTLFHHDPYVAQFIGHLDLVNKEKLRFVRTEGDPLVIDIVRHVSENMVGKTVMLMNMDNVLGQGVEHIDVKKFQNEDIAYALTRWMSTNGCPESAKSANCNPGSKYRGSHDAFVFSLKRKLDEEDMSILHFTHATSGQENVVICFLKNVLNYKVTNPCKVIQINHEHCISIRARSGPRVNNNGLSCKARFTDVL